MITTGTTTINDVRIGTVQVVAVYIGANLIWVKP